MKTEGTEKIDFSCHLRLLVVDDVAVHRLLLVSGIGRINPFVKADEAGSGSEAMAKLGGAERYDAELLAKLVEIFSQNCPLIGTGSLPPLPLPTALLHAAHSLKGMLGTLAAHDGEVLALRLEEMGRRGELAEAAETLVDLDRELEALKTMFLQEYA